MSHYRHNKRVQVSFGIELWKVIEKLRGKLGNTDSEIVRSIVIAWLSEKSMIPTEREGTDNETSST